MDAYDKIAQKLLESKDDAGNWVPCWHRSGLGLPSNAITRKPYHGINVLACWVTQHARGYGTDLWATYAQWQDAGAQVQRGEKGTPIVFWKKVEAEDPDARDRWVIRGYTVFNRDQVINPPPLVVDPDPLGEDARISKIEVFVGNVRQTVDIEEKEIDVPHYNRRTDRVMMPIFARFDNAVGYYTTLLHECCHWTGHPDREDRTFGERFGDDAYALEELVAELGCVFIATDLGLEAEPRPDHAAYIAHWHRILSDNPAAFAQAVGLARKAATRVLDLGKGEDHEHRSQGADGELAQVEP